MFLLVELGGPCVLVVSISSGSPQIAPKTRRGISLSKQLRDLCVGCKSNSKIVRQEIRIFTSLLVS